MNRYRFLQGLSYLGLLLTIVPGILVFAGLLDLPAYKSWMLAGTVIYFVTAPWWINREA